MILSEPLLQLPWTEQDKPVDYVQKQLGPHFFFFFLSRALTDSWLNMAEVFCSDDLLTFPCSPGWPDGFGSRIQNPPKACLDLTFIDQDVLQMICSSTRFITSLIPGRRGSLCSAPSLIHADSKQQLQSRSGREPLKKTAIQSKSTDIHIFLSWKKKPTTTTTSWFNQSLNIRLPAPRWIVSRTATLGLFTLCSLSVCLNANLSLLWINLMIQSFLPVIPVITHHWYLKAARRKGGLVWR